MAITRDNKVRALQRKLYMLSKQEANYRFYSLYDKIYRQDVLAEAYRQCRANQGSPGVDGETFSDIENQGVQSWLKRISDELRTRSYRPLPVKRVHIQKPDGGKRPLGIPAIRDRIVQGALKIVIEPIFEAHLNANSYGYRPKRGAADAVRHIERLIKQGYVHVYDADLKGYFNAIPHDRLLDKIARRISDSSTLALVRKILRAPVAEMDASGRTTITKTKRGTPQGGVASSLFANIYLNDFSDLINTRTPCRMVSYADDFVILNRQPFTQRQIRWFRSKLAHEGLTVNEAKTHVVNMGRHRAEFDFLGFNFKMAPCRFKQGHCYMKLQPAKKSQMKFKNTIRGIVKHRTSRNLEKLIAAVNPVIRGWRNYFSQCGYPKHVFFKMDWFVVARFYRWSRRLSQRRSKRLAPDALKTLITEGLELFAAPKRLAL